jgi:hypothetical protein
LPLAALVFEVSDELLLLGVDGDDGLPCREEVLRLRVDVLELGVAIGMVIPSRVLSLACRL